jgi:intein/homing endonuclease
MYIETKRGFSFLGDKDLLTFNGVDFIFKRVDDVCKGDVVCIDRSSKDGGDDLEINYQHKSSKYASNIKEVNLPKKYSPDLGEWLGYIVANGSTSQNCVMMSSNESAKTINYEELVARLFGISAVKENCSGAARSFKIHSVVVKGFLNHLTGGFKTARYKSVPYGVFESSKETQRRFLRALFDCDASKLKSSFEYSSASEELAKGVVSLLLGFGIISRAKRAYAKNYPEHTYWKVLISGENEDLLYDKILFDSFKYLPIEHKKRNTNIDVIYGFKEYLVNELNKTRKILGVNSAGTYKCNDKTVRFTASRTILKISHKELTYQTLKCIFDDFNNCCLEQKECLSCAINRIALVIKGNYFLDVVDVVDCEKELDYDLPFQGFVIKEQFNESILQ